MQFPEGDPKTHRATGLAPGGDAVVLTVGKQSLRVAWSLVLGAVIDEDCLYLLVARQPPRPPWYVIRAHDLGGDVVDACAAIEMGVNSQHYRSQRPRERLTAVELKERVVNRKSVEGAVEIPVGTGPHMGAFDRALNGLLPVGLGGVTGFVTAGLLAALALGTGPVAWAVGLGGGVGAGLATARIAKTKSRVLVLAPDGCVFGSPAGVRAENWTDLADFSLTGTAGNLLQISDRSGQVLGEIDTAWLDASPHLVLKVANAYRKRVS